RGCGPDGEEIQRHRIDRDAVLPEYVSPAGDPGVRGDGIEEGVVGNGKLRLAVNEIEGPVPHEWPAQRKPELVVANHLLGTGGALKWRPRSQRLIAVVVVCASVRGIVSRLDPHVDARPAVAPGIRTAVALHR